MATENAPATPPQPVRVVVTPDAPRPIRRTETNPEGLFAVRRTLLFGQPPTPPVPEERPGEDASMTEERFGVDTVRDAQAANALFMWNGVPVQRITPAEEAHLAEQLAAAARASPLPRIRSASGRRGVRRP